MTLPQFPDPEVEDELEILNKNPTSPKLIIIRSSVRVRAWPLSGLVQISLLSLSGYVTSVELFNLAKPQFPDL